MPIITVHIAPTRDMSDLEQKVAHRVVDLVSRILRKPAEVTAVIVERVNPAVWFVAGRSLLDQDKASYWLSVKVVDGTNTKDEKAQFLSALFEAMGDLLGDLHPESYGYVEEVFADSYGFGGVTQERRYVEKVLAGAAGR
ncbi:MULTISPECIES: 4-oxalocrotonate tautomerase family protein [Caulobacter]|jgi:4-oxalocrotonate tautomerase|uniref:4-oxalocrotonate tautomerase n=1 Tax=Caulobacter rhizosphaerae TaxID=2010972 RepID=A0ABU1N554_9CAUL|nr:MULTISPECIES: 4-oxalocrotonate tautomerase family protein [Caulobacter]KQZ17588.1 4-oxalocrotonate tautomerase [Caulobacter sp. Root1472]MDR6533216.1 4-oxalocrotonate tautomerase [Caulobacter rhizosphaerae]